jgi:(2S)-methylsuccinyl-CoA dehydrogenase
MTSLHALMPAAKALLADLRATLDAEVAALADLCTVNGELSTACLDREQTPSYELAFAAAELLAADTALAAAGARGDLGLRLALTCAAEAAQSVTARLRQAALDLGCDAALPETTAEQRGLYAAVLGGHALDETGRLLGESTAEIGSIPLDDDSAMAQGEFRRFAADVVAPLASEIHRRDAIVPDAILTPLREMGVFGLSIPSAYGGSAPDDRDNNLLMIVVTEALSEASLAAAGSLITRPEILSRALLAGGTPQQRSLWLPRIAAGDPLCAIAITEPDYGSDVASLQLKATKTQGGWLLNGAKTWCTFAGKAGVLMVVARTSADRTLAHRGLSIFLVEKPSGDGHAFEYASPRGGRLVGKAIATIGYRGMHSFDLAFENWFVPDENLLGGDAGLGKGFYFTMAGMVGGRMQTAARACGVMRAALRAAMHYAANRRVFNAPLADYSLTRAKLARMAARYVACRELTYAVGRLLDAGEGRMETSLVKLFACRSAEWLTREALQIHGGMGYAEETAISRYFVDARVLSIFEGAEETLAIKVVARSLFEAARRRRDGAEAA